jgi:hypothetical protein
MKNLSTIVPLCVEEGPYGANLVAVEPDNEVAMLKARTLLAFLNENDALTSETFNDRFNIIWPRALPKPELRSVYTDMTEYDFTVKALIGVTWKRPAWHQPGFILVDTSLEDSIYERFLDYSSSWMDNNADQRVYIRNNLPVAMLSDMQVQS